MDMHGQLIHSRHPFEKNEEMESPEINQDSNDSHQSHERLDLTDDENDQQTIRNREDEAEEVPAPGEDTTANPVKPKRIVKNPQPKLDTVRLMGPRGIGILQNVFNDAKFKGKGHEKEDLNLLMKKLEHWAHRLFPKLPFDDMLKQIEKLGTKKPVQNQMKRIRLDMFQSDEMVSEENSNVDQTAKDVEEVDVFDELLGTGPFAARSSSSVVISDDITNSNNVISTQQTLGSSHQKTLKTLSEEQKKRIELNKQQAAERRRAKQLEKTSNEQKEVQNISSKGTEDDLSLDADLIVASLPNNVIPNSQNDVQERTFSQSNDMADKDTFQTFLSPSASDANHFSKAAELSAVENAVTNNLELCRKSDSVDKQHSSGYLQVSKNIYTEDEILTMMDTE